MILSPFTETGSNVQETITWHIKDWEAAGWEKFIKMLFKEVTIVRRSLLSCKAKTQSHLKEVHKVLFREVTIFRRSLSAAGQDWPFTQLILIG